jgi:transposase-like protein
MLFEHCKRRTDTIPRFILSDGLRAYQDGIEQVFGSDSNHIVVKGLTSEINNNLIERFHSTLKERYKVMRGLKTMESAWVVLNGFVFNYDFFRPHMSLDNTTPAKVAGIKLPFSDWEGFIRYESTT